MFQATLACRLLFGEWSGTGLGDEDSLLEAITLGCPKP